MEAASFPRVFSSSPEESGPATQPVERLPRSKRSCDFCRKRKTACRVDDDPPCFTCKNLGQQCTFAERPPKRRRTVTGSTAAQPRGNLSIGSGERSIGGLPDEFTSPEQHPGAPQMMATSPAGLSDGSIIGDTRRLVLIEKEAERSLDSITDRTAFLLGDTGESDPYLSQHFAQDHVEQSFVAQVQCRHIQLDNRVDNATTRPLVFYLADHGLYKHGEPRLDDHVLAALSEEVDAMCSPNVAVRLARLYFRFVYASFPVVSKTHYFYHLRERLKESPLSLRAALIATGLAFASYDDVLATTLAHSFPSTQRLWQIVWLAATHEMHTPHLATLQSCLLLLQRINDDRYVMDTPFRWSLIAWSVALAQSLGLSTDCSHWENVPAWEKRLRRRLWWAVYVVDKWSFMSAGLASHIRGDDFDVSPLTTDDLVTDRPVSVSDTGEVSKEGYRYDPSERSLHFLYLVQLSVILADILNAYFSVRASARTRQDFGLSLEIARPLRSRLKQWKARFDEYSLRLHTNTTRSPVGDLDGTASLGLAYPVATIILFRALLRPLESPSSSSEDKERMVKGREAVRMGAQACCVESVEFVEGLRRNTWDAFWHSWSRAGFATISSLMVRLLITAEAQLERQRLNDLIGRWRWGLRTGGSSGLTSLGLLRLDQSLTTKGIFEIDDDVE